MSNEYIRLLDCPVCGKRFVPATHHVYRVGNNCVCSWGCQRKVVKAEEERKKLRIRKRKARTMYKECESCVYCDTDKDDQPCCYCVDAMHYERGGENEK